MKRESPYTANMFRNLFLCCRIQPECVRVSFRYLTHSDPWAKIKANSREMGSDKLREYTTVGGVMLGDFYLFYGPIVLCMCNFISVPVMCCSKRLSRFIQGVKQICFDTFHDTFTTA